MRSEKSIYFKNLDSIRFFAALMVFLQHGISNSYQYLGLENTVLGRILDVISSGDTGVSIFFVLSGFLITYLLVSEHELNDKVDVRKFYIRRFLRIWPLFYAVVFFSFIVYPGSKAIFGVNTALDSNFIYHIFFLSNFDVINILSQGPGFLDAMSQNITWSVSIEEQFYLFWPLLFLAPKKYWIYGILSVLTLSILFRLSTENDTILYFHTIAVLCDLSLGGLFAYMVKKHKYLHSAFERTSTATHILIFTAVAMVLYFETGWLFSTYEYALNRVFTSLIFAILITSQALTKTESPLNLSKITFANRWGKYTYGIYLLHPIAIIFADIPARLLKIKQHDFISTFSIGLVAFIFTLVLSKLSYHYYESWFLKLKKKYQLVKSRSTESE